MPRKLKPLGQRLEECEQYLFDNFPLPACPYTTALRWEERWHQGLLDGSGLKQISMKRFRRSLNHWVRYVHSEGEPPIWIFPKRGETEATIIVPFWLKRLMRQAQGFLELANEPEINATLFGGQPLGFWDYVQAMATGEYPHYHYLADEPSNKEQLTRAGYHALIV